MHADSSTLQGRTAVITGAGGGIGRALAIRAAAEGMAVAVCDLDAASLGRTVDEVGALGARFTAAALDVRDSGALGVFASQVAAEAPPVALLFANAGLLRRGHIATQSPADWRLMWDVNVIGALQTVQAFLPAISSHEEPARIVITGSQASFAAFPRLGGYAATKHALWALAETLRQELEGTSIAVSLIAPGAVDTPINAEGDPTALAAVALDARTRGSMAPDELAQRVFAGLGEHRFLISTHASARVLAEPRFRSLLEEM